MTNKTELLKATHVDVREIAADLVKIERRLYDLGLVATAQALNSGPLNKLGWEFAHLKGKP